MLSIRADKVWIGKEAAMNKRSDRESSVASRWAASLSETASSSQASRKAGSSSNTQTVPGARRSASSARSLRDRDQSDPYRRTVELAQRGRLILDVSSADLEAAEETFGPFHPTTWHFRNSLNEARQSWERLRAEFGTKALESALQEPPLAVLTLNGPGNGSLPVKLVLIAGQTYRIHQVAGTELAPVQWRLTRLQPPLDDGPYYVCRLADGSIQCDCAQWTYRIAETDCCLEIHCKHQAALAALGWI